MKRLFLLPFLVLGFSFACDQPYEDVGGLKLGCPYNITLQPLDEQDAGRVKVVEEGLSDSFFQRVDIKTLDGNIEEVSFRKTYHNILDMNRELESLLNTLKDRWGKYEEINVDGRTRIYIIKKPNSDILESVFTTLLFKNALGLVSTTSYVELSVTYFSKKINSYTQSLSAQEVHNLVKKLEGF